MRTSFICLLFIGSLFAGCASPAEHSAVDDTFDPDAGTEGEVGGASEALFCSSPLGGCIDRCAPAAPRCPSGRRLIVDADGSEDACRCGGIFGRCFPAHDTAPTCPSGYSELVIDYGLDQCLRDGCGQGGSTY